MKIKHILILFAALGIVVISCGACPQNKSAKAKCTKVATQRRGTYARRKAKRRLKRRPCRRRIKKSSKEATAVEGEGPFLFQYGKLGR